MLHRARSPGHSSYVRTLLDLPMGGRSVQLRVVARRFRCDAPACARQIFAERLGPVAPWARRTARLDTLGHHLGLALGGRPAAQFASRLMLPLSNDTLLRLVRRRGTPAFAPASSGRDRRLGLEAQPSLRHVICDLERRRTISLLPDREPARRRHGWPTGRRSTW